MYIHKYVCTTISVFNQNCEMICHACLLVFNGQKRKAGSLHGGDRVG